MKWINIEKEMERLRKTIVKPSEKVNKFLEEKGTPPLSTGSKLSELLKRTEIRYKDLAQIDENMPELSAQEKEEVEIQIKYEGYIKKDEREAEKMLKNEEKQIPEDINYDLVPNLASEARQKLKEVRPLTIAQAIRISGVNPSDISILLVYLRKQYNE